MPGSSTAGQAFFKSASAPAPEAAAEEEEEVDLFAEDEEDDEEAEKLKAERVAAYNAKKAGKPKAAAKVRFFLSSLKVMVLMMDIVCRDIGG